MTNISSFTQLVDKLNPEVVDEQPGNALDVVENDPLEGDFAYDDEYHREKSVHHAVAFLNSDVIAEYTTDVMLKVADRIYKYIKTGQIT